MSISFFLYHEEKHLTTTKIHYRSHLQREKTRSHLGPTADGTYKLWIQCTKKKKKHAITSINLSKLITSGKKVWKVKVEVGKKMSISCPWWKIQNVSSVSYNWMSWFIILHPISDLWSVSSWTKRGKYFPFFISWCLISKSNLWCM